MNYRIEIGDHLANEDQFTKIQALIEAKRQSLLDKQKKFKTVTKTNEFLNSVKEDYVKYYNVIVAQKQDQIKAITMLNEYVEDLASSGELSANNIEDARVEQSKLLREVKQIKRGLDSLAMDTNHVTNELHKKI
jgi:flagellar biosynthesis chaperone FliJ